jgi:small-conductance mechanosensitive channel
MNNKVSRGLSLIAGMAAALIGAFLPLLFLWNERQEAASAAQWGGHAIPGMILAWIVALAFAVAMGYAGYRLIRFAIGESSRD